MANTYVIYTGDGVQTDFSIPFSKLDEAFVKVSVDGVDTAFSFLSDTVAQVIPAPADGTAVRVYRETQRDSLITEIPTSGLIKGSDINSQSQQALDVSEEAFDALTGTMAEDFGGNLDALSRRIVNLQDPVDDQDAVTKVWAETAGDSWVAQAAASAATAATKASQTAADRTQTGLDRTQTGADRTQTTDDRTQTGLDKAATAADRVQTGSDKAATAADRVQTGSDRTAVSNDKATVAADKATVIADMGTVAADKATVLTAKTDTLAARDLAQEWASNPEDTEVVTGQYSALHWAAKAAASAATVLGDLASLIHGATSKGSLTANDEIVIADSASSYGLKKVLWSTVASIFAPIVHTHAATDVASGTLADARLPERLGLTCLMITDANTATANGWYMGSNISNAPSTSWWLIETITHIEALWCIQTAYPFTSITAGSSGIQRRVRTNGTWGAWFSVMEHQAELDARFVLKSTAKLQRFYESGQQIITAGGALTLAHGLGVKPTLFSVALVCVTADSGYSVGDEVQINVGENYAVNLNSKGLSIVPDASYLHIRIGSQSATFDVMNKTNGNVSAIVNSSWHLVFRAWA